MLNCLKCGYEWKPRKIEIPICCPKCKRYTWMEATNGKQNSQENRTAPKH